MQPKIETCYGFLRDKHGGISFCFDHNPRMNKLDATCNLLLTFRFYICQLNTSSNNYPQFHTDTIDIKSC